MFLPPFPTTKQPLAGWFSGFSSGRTAAPLRRGSIEERMLQLQERVEKEAREKQTLYQREKVCASRLGVCVNCLVTSML